MDSLQKQNTSETRSPETSDSEPIVMLQGKTISKIKPNQDQEHDENPLNEQSSISNSDMDAHKTNSFGSASHLEVTRHMDRSKWKIPLIE